MATYTPDQYQRKMRAMAKELTKAARKSAHDAAMFMVRTAKGMAPIKSGALREGIRSDPVTGSEYEVSCTVPDEFPYPFWVNRTAPYRTLHFGAKGGWIPAHKSFSGRSVRVFPPNSNIVYGDGSHRNTGTPRFWYLATLRTYDLFGRITRLNVQKALRVRVI